MALNRGRHIYSAGRPSRWALAHILVTGSIARCATCRYLIYSKADFEVFAPQVRHLAPMGVKFGTEEGTKRGPLLHAKFQPHRCNVLSLRGKKPQNRPLSNLNTGALLLPVIRRHQRRTWTVQSYSQCAPHIESQKMVAMATPLKPRNRLCLHRIA